MNHRTASSGPACPSRAAAGLAAVLALALVASGCFIPADGYATYPTGGTTSTGAIAVGGCPSLSLGRGGDDRASQHLQHRIVGRLTMRCWVASRTTSSQPNGGYQTSGFVSAAKN